MYHYHYAFGEITMNHPSLSELYQLRNKLQNEIISLKIKNRSISQRFKSNKELNLGEMVQYYYEQCNNSRDIARNRKHKQLIKYLLDGYHFLHNDKVFYTSNFANVYLKELGFKL